MTNGLALIINVVVAILLALTIAYCVLLNRRLKLLKTDEHALKATIAELAAATGVAERAIAGLKLTVQECESGLGERLAGAERLSADLDRGVAAGREVLSRLVRITSAAGGPGGGVVAVAAPRHDVAAVAAAAHAVAERLRLKVHGLAA